MTDTPRCVESCVGVYEALIRVYPASFRREYADEMTLVFREHMTDVWRSRGVVGLMTAWFRVLGDLAATVPGEHLHEMQRRMGMKTTALAVLSVVLAAIVHWFIFAGGIAVAIFPLVMHGTRAVQEGLLLTIFYLSAFLTGLLLSRVKPFFKPSATVPLAIMAVWGLWGVLAYLGSGPPREELPWFVPLLGAGFVASLGLASLLGCIVATRAASRLDRFSIQWYQWVGPLAVLVCTSFVTCMIHIVSMGNRVAPDLEAGFAWCRFALLLIAAITIANLAIVVVHNYRKAGVRCAPIEQVRPCP